ncbi:glycosyltransferase [Catenuloplanes sp. NPDC051500]|uniref:glycosyltransferase n=1 Tax=Catenuloplanes sp. NPDC051500 TaxID=3363959 RepID=UPI0037B2D29C
MNRVAVVVPAHDEQDLLPACLAALHRAADALGRTPVEIVVVADHCRDRTAELAAGAGAEVVTVAHRNVGRARAAGVAHAVRHGPAGLWVACTDADSRVGADWLRWQLRHAEDGAGLLLGTVEVDDWASWPTTLPARYEARYRRKITGAVHGHVHGANLGFPAETYLAVGGFPGLAVAEDRVFAKRVRDGGARVVTDPSCPVRTSARPRGRARHGFASYLTALSGVRSAAPRIRPEPL